MASKADGLRDYNEVAQRVEGFLEQYPDGRIVTAVTDQSIEITDVEERTRNGRPYLQPIAKGYVTVRAEAYKDRTRDEPDGVGHSTMLIPGTTQYTRDSEVENAETSAVGRALAFIGFFAKGESLASKQEIAAKGGDSGSPTKQTRSTKKEQGDLTEQAQEIFAEQAEQAVVGRSGLTAKQKKLLFATLRENEISDEDRKGVINDIVGKTSVKDMTGEDLDTVIAYFKAGKG